MSAPNMVENIDLGGSVAAAQDLSMWGLFIEADLIVKVVMLILIAASFWCWAIIADKYMGLKRLNIRARRFEDSFWSGEPLDKLYQRIHGNPTDPMSRVFAAGMREWQRATEKGVPSETLMRAGIQQRVERAMSLTIGREMDKVERYMTFLASVGSTAPFIGLFGTVWGIMNSFSAIASTQNTSLAVVAPGIAEALFATAMGLVAAIPAVIAYNKFSTDLGRYADRLDAFSTEFSSILSRHMDKPAGA